MARKFGTSKWKEADALRLIEELITWLKLKEENVIYEEFFYLYVNEDDYPGKIYPQLFYVLRKKYVSFELQYTVAKKITEIKLKTLSLKKINSESMSKFLLSSEYGYSDKSEQVVTVKNTPIMSIDPLAEPAPPKKKPVAKKKPTPKKKITPPKKK